MPNAVCGPDDIVIGQPVSPYPHPVVRLTPADQAYHATIWGRTGSGKSRLLQSLFLQHLSRGHGVCLIEPHHDLSLDTLSYLVAQGYFQRPDAFDRLIYLDVGNGDIMPFNVLARPGDAHTIASHALEGMIRVWPELRRAPSFQTLFLAALVTLIEHRLPLTALYRFLIEQDFRDPLVAASSDPLVQQVLTRYNKAGQSNQDVGSALRRAFLLSFHPLTRLCFGQPDCVLDIRTLMDQGTSLIVNLGNIEDAETRRLFGALLMVQIEQAALSRKTLAPHERRPWTVLLDEWPSFAAVDGSIAAMLEQTRKFGLRLYLAAQSVGQVGSDRLQAALENCRLNIVFGLGHESARLQAREITVLDPTLLKTDPVTGRPQVVSSAQQYEMMAQDVQTLSPQLAYVKLHTDPPVKVRMLHVKDPTSRAADVERAIKEYRRRYQRAPTEAENLASRVAGAQHSEPESLAPFTLFGGGKSTV